jgi:ribonuclease HI
MHKDDDLEILEQLSTNVYEVLDDLELEEGETIKAGLSRTKNILSEMTALYLAVAKIRGSSAVTVVHDYVGVSDWIEGRSKRARDPLLRWVIERTKDLIAERDLTLTFRHQKGHRSDWAGRHDYARLNRLADDLATRGARDGGQPD